jgi:hypothetical protein
MAKSKYFREQAARAQRLAQHSTDPVLQTSLLKLAEEYNARAGQLEGDEAVAQVREPDSG